MFVCTNLGISFKGSNYVFKPFVPADAFNDYDIGEEYEIYVSSSKMQGLLRRPTPCIIVQDTAFSSYWTGCNWDSGTFIILFLVAEDRHRNA